MGRYLSGIVAIAAGVGVYQYNLTHTDSQVFLFGVNLIVGDDPVAQGDLTWKLLIGIGMLWLGYDLVGAMRRRATEEPAQDEG